MKNYFYIVTLTLFLLLGCHSKKSAIASPERNLIVKNDSLKIAKNAVKVTNDTIRIANDSLQYEVIIIDPGFSTWLVSQSFPRGYHSLTYLESKNQLYVNEWNNRVHQPQQYNPNLYEMSINYEPFIHYGYEVNYLIYNYMIYFQNTYKQNLNGYVPSR